MLLGFAGQGETRVIQTVQFWGDLGLVGGGELRFWKLKSHAPEALQKTSVLFIQIVPFHTQIFLLSLVDTSFEDVLNYYKQLTSCFYVLLNLCF